MRGQQQRLPGTLKRADFLETALIKFLVPDAEYFVHKQYVRIRNDGDGNARRMLMPEEYVRRGS